MEAIGSVWCILIGKILDLWLKYHVLCALVFGFKQVSIVLVAVITNLAHELMIQMTKAVKARLNKRRGRSN